MLIAVFLSAVLCGGLCALLWHRYGAGRWTVTHQTVRCPLHVLDATLSLRTAPQSSHGNRYQAVTACSLLPESTRLAPAVARLPLLTYEGPYPLLEPMPRYTASVSCGQDCLYVLNGTADRCHHQQHSHTAGLHSCVSPRQQAEAAQHLQRTLLYHSV